MEISSLVHELRTPMTAILGGTRLLQDTQLTLEQQQFLAIITHSSNLMLTIINDILDFSKMEAGQLKLEKSSHSLVDAVEAAVLLCHDAAATKGLDLHYWVQPDVPQAFLVDATRLQQIHAIKFTQQGQVGLTVTAAPVAVAPLSARISSDPTRAGVLSLSSCTASPVRSSLWEVCFHVKDQGIGISEADLSKLFQSFSQATHISSKYGGTGLGLVISKRLAEAMGGRIWCTSEVGVGSTFSFSIQVEVQDSIGGGGSNSSSLTSSPNTVKNAADVPLWPATAVAPLQLEKDLPAALMSTAAAATTQDGSHEPQPFIPTLPFALQTHTPTAADSTVLSPPRAMPPPAPINPYNLNEAECAMLRQSRVLLLGKRSGSLAVWAQLLGIYGCQTHIESRSGSALQYLYEQHASPATRVSLFILEGFDSWSLGVSSSSSSAAAGGQDPNNNSNSSPSGREGSQGAASTSEESMDDLLDPALLASVQQCTPLSLLFLTDRYYHAMSARSTPVGLVRSLPPSASLPTLSAAATAASALSVSGLGLSSAFNSHPISPSNNGSLSSDPVAPSAASASLSSSQRLRQNQAEKIVSAGDAAVAKLQTRSPAVMGRRLGRKDSTASNGNGNGNGNGSSSTANSSSPLLLISGASSSSPPDHHSLALPPAQQQQQTHQQQQHGFLQTQELSMPFKHRDFLLCVLRQLFRMQEPSSRSTADSATMPAPLRNAVPSHSQISPPLTLPAADGLGGRTLSASASLLTDRLLMASQASVNTMLAGGKSTPSSTVSRSNASPQSAGSDSSPASTSAGTDTPSREVSRSYSHSNSSSSSSSSASSHSSHSSSGGSKSSSTSTFIPIANLARDHPLRILLTEDNLVNQKMMVMLLRKLGYEILVASNGVEALEVLEREAQRGKEHEVEVVLMDASMDVMGGEECTRLIRARQKPDRIVPYIIAQTANVSPQYKQACIDAGMDSFLAKPIVLEALVASLKVAWAAQHAQYQRRQQQQQQQQQQQGQQQAADPSTADGHSAGSGDSTADSSTTASPNDQQQAQAAEAAVQTSGQIPAVASAAPQ